MIAMSYGNSGFDYSNLFRITLPETMLEVVSLLVLVVDLGVLRKGAQSTRMTAACTLGVLGSMAAMLCLALSAQVGSVAAGSLVAAPLVAAVQVGILLLTALVLLLSLKASFSRNPGEFVAIVLLATTGMLLMTAARDLLVIFVALELLSISLYVLTAFAKGSALSAEAALKYYLFGGMSAALMLFGFSYLYGLTGTTNLPAIAGVLISQPVGQSGPLLIVALVLVAAGLGFKVAAVPFHLWAPDTYQGAPAPVTALIASGSKVASFAVLVAITSAVMPVSSVPGAGRGNAWIILLISMAAGSIVLGNLGALVQTSVRRLLAYSAIAHAGYMLLGIAAHTPQSDVAVLYYALTYALTTVGAFGVVGVVERSTGSDRFDSFAGLSRRNPLLAGVMLILLLSLAGIPPLVGFWAKFNLFAAVLRAPAAAHWSFGMVAMALGASAVSLYYYLQVLKRVYVLKPAQPEAMPVSSLELATLTAIAFVVALLGVLPGLLSRWVPFG